jgi:glyoxylase I family protein
MIKGIAHLCIGAKDLANTEHFYCDILGFKKKFRFFKDSREFGYYLETGRGSFIEVFEKKDLDKNLPQLVWHLSFEVEGIDAIRENILAHGIGVTEKALGCDNTWQIWTEDPSGIKIEFHEYTKESSQRTGKDCIVNWKTW